MPISFPFMRVNPNTVWILLLVGLLFVRFGYEIIGQPAFVISTYLLSYLFFRTVPKTDRYLYNLSRPNKKLVLIACAVALLGLAMNIAVELLFMGSRLDHQFTEIGNPMIFAVLFPIVFPLELAGILITQFVLNALPEELLFRGILWGSLRRCKLSDFSILCVQAILFWAGHYYYYDTPQFWIRVLLAGLIFGIVAWKTRSLFLSAIVHACMNSTSLFVHQ
jgi:membrane protease YdiL (CAAX protease family)